MAQPLIEGNPFKNAEAVASANRKTDSILPTLSLKEKVAQMNTQGTFFYRAFHNLLWGKGIPLMKIGENKKKGIPPATFMDGPRGVVNPGHTNFPCAMARAASWNTELEQRIGETMGEDAKHAGANLLGAPCMNLLRNPLNGRAQEAYGEDPYLTGAMASALVRGVQSKGVIATLKHYALNSIENTRFVVDVKIDKRTLNEVYLPHFIMAIDEGAASVMSAYNKVNGTYCGENAPLLNDILRKDWKFKGFVHSDWIFGTRSTAESIKAGMNVEMPQPVYYKYKEIKKLIDEGKLKESDIDALVRPTMFTKFLFHYFTSKSKVGTIEHSANAANALEAARESTVLLKNDNNLLPLDSTKIKKLALVGFLSDKENDGDHGSSYSRSKYVVTPLQAFKKFCQSKGIELMHCTGEDQQQLKDVCAKADAVVVIGGIYHLDEGEYMTLKKNAVKTPGEKSRFAFGLRMRGGGDRESLSLQKRDLDVIETASSSNKNTAVMLIGGSAITMEEWKNKVPAILMSWYSGMEGGTAMPEIIFGEVNPSGKLPFTIPVKESDLPQQPFAPLSIQYDYYHGYTLFEKKDLPIAFPFGYGLSYTTFEMGEVNIEKADLSEQENLNLSVTVKNTGTRSGKEVVQLYIGFEESKIDRPLKLLRAFEKVELKPGEQKTVKVSIPIKSLAFYDETANDWRIEKMSYTALVGNSSAPKDLNLAKFRVN